MSPAVVPEGYIANFICTVKLCDVKIWGYVKYQPSIPGNALFLAIMIAIALTQIYLGYRYKTGWVCAAMVVGLWLEGTGYIVRLLLHNNPFDRVLFLIYLISLTLGPVFFAAAIYLCLGRIVVVYGEGLSKLKPKTYTVVFLTCDFVSLVVQGVGGAIAASFPLTNQVMIDLGTHILIAGLAFQVASLTVFLVMCSLFLVKAWKNKHQLNPEFADLYNSTRFKAFLGSLAVATLCIFTRSVFRSVELSEGFSGKLANNETSFMVLDGVMIIIACLCLTVFHPGMSFGKENWKRSGFKFSKEKEEITMVT